MLFVMSKCNTNLNLYVKFYGHKVAMYLHAPGVNLLQPLLIHCKIYWTMY